MNIPTAEQLAEQMFIKNPGAYSSFNRVSFTGKQLKEVAIALAKLHVQAALESAKDNASTITCDLHGQDTCDIDDDSILNAYPLNNIK